MALEGDVSLVEFAKAISNLNRLLNQLTKEVNKDDADVDWIVDELYAGSAVATFRGVNGDLSSVENVVNAYEDVGDSLQSGRNINYSATTQRYARDLVSVIADRVTSIRFETPEKDFVIVNRPTRDIQEVLKYAWSSVKGTVETLSHRKKLSFTLWDTLFDKPVSCYFKEGQEDIMRTGMTKGWKLRAIDAIHLASAQWAQCYEINTYDGKWDKYKDIIGGIEIREPFTESPKLF